MRSIFRAYAPVLAFVSVFTLLTGAGCGGSDEPAGMTCPDISGDAWVPSVPGVSASNHNSVAQISQQVITGSGGVVGLGQAAPTSAEIPITIDMTSALGGNGSLTLQAEVTSFPSQLAGWGYAVLVSLKDTNNREWINLPRNGSSSDCVQSGYFLCSNGDCSNPNPNCSPTWPSAYSSRSI